METGRLGRARRRSSGDADLRQRPGPRLHPQHRGRRPLSVHHQGSGGEQGRRAGHAVSLRADLAPRHAADARLLHSARGPDRRDGRRRRKGRELQEDRRLKERELGRHRRLARLYRQILGGGSPARDRRQGEDPLLRHQRQRPGYLSDRLSGAGADRGAGRDRLDRLRGCSPAPRKSPSSASISRSAPAATIRRSTSTSSIC